MWGFQESVESIKLPRRLVAYFNSRLGKVPRSNRGYLLYSKGEVAIFQLEAMLGLHDFEDQVLVLCCIYSQRFNSLGL